MDVYIYAGSQYGICIHLETDAYIHKGGIHKCKVTVRNMYTYVNTCLHMCNQNVMYVYIYVHIFVHCYHAHQKGFRDRTRKGGDRSK
jgi:hypothetical protein